MTYDFDTDNSWLDAQVTAEPVKVLSKSASAKTPGRKQYQMSPEFRERVSQGARKHHVDPKYRKKISDTLKGRQQTPEHTARAKEARRLALIKKHPPGHILARQMPQKCAGNTDRRWVQVTTPKGVFDSAASAAKAYGVAPTTFKYWVYVSKTDQFSAKPNVTSRVSAFKAKSGKPIMTPTGVFPSKSAAGDWAQAHGLVNAHRKIDKWLKTHPDQFYYIPKEPK